MPLIEPPQSRWQSRFLQKRLDGLTDPRPGVPRTITDAQVEEVVVRTLEEVPEGARHWPECELARKTGISATSVQRIWRAFGLQPWRTETFKISPDPLLVPKIRDVIGLYLAPPANAAVFSQALQVDQDPRPDPRRNMPLLRPNLTTSSLVLADGSRPGRNCEAACEAVR